MKTRLLVLILLSGYSISTAQSLSEKLQSTDVIYVAPLTHYDYYALKRGAGEATKGAFDHKGKYMVGDVTSDAVDPNVSFEIVGQFTEEMLAEVNQKVLDQIKAAYGSDKVKPWPQELTNKMTGNWDQKKIDCKYYIIFKRMATSDPVMVQFFDLNSNSPSSNPTIVGGGDMFSIHLFEKTKAGKKGKPIVKINHKMSKGVDAVPLGDDYKKAAEILVNALNENFPKVVNAAVEEFIAEVNQQ